MSGTVKEQHRPLHLPTEATAEELDTLYQRAYDALEDASCWFYRGGGEDISMEHGHPEVTLADIGALAVVCDRVDTQLGQSRDLLGQLERAKVDLLVLRAEQQGRLSRGEEL